MTSTIDPDVGAASEDEPPRSRWNRLAKRHDVRLAAAVLGGLLAGIAGVGGGPPGLIVAAVCAIPFIVACLASIAGETALFGALVGVLGVASAITVHHSPDVTAFEVIVLVPATYVVCTRGPELLRALRRERMAALFALASLGLLILSTLYALWHPIYLGHPAAAKELGKNVEIVVLSLAVFAYSRTRRDFARVYSVLVALVLSAALEPLARYRGHALSVDSLMTEAPLLLVLLVLPWVRRVPIAFVAAIGAVILVAARTRGAWIGAIAVALVVLAQRRVRSVLGRAGIATVGIAVVALIAAVLSVSSARARVDALVSGHDQSINTRWTMIRAAAIEAERHPWTGVGPGEFKHWMLVHGSPVQFRIGLSAIPRDPHNVLAKFAAEMGVPGLALIVLWTVAVISSPWIAWRRRASSRRHEVLPYLLGLCLYAPIYLTFLIVSEWGSLTRVRLAIGAGLFLSLLRVLPDSADVTKEAA